MEHVSENITVCGVVERTVNRMDDLISRQAAIEAIKSLYPDKPKINFMDNFSNWEEKNKQYIECEQTISNLPSAQPTLYGYKIEHLALIARVMEKEGVSPDKAVETFQNIVGIVQMIADEQKEIIRKAVEQWT